MSTKDRSRSYHFDRQCSDGGIEIVSRRPKELCVGGTKSRTAVDTPVRALKLQLHFRTPRILPRKYLSIKVVRSRAFYRDEWVSEGEVPKTAVGDGLDAGALGLQDGVLCRHTGAGSSIQSRTYSGRATLPTELFILGNVPYDIATSAATSTLQYARHELTAC